MSSKTFFIENDIDYFENDEFMTDLYKNPMEYIIDIDFHPNKKGYFVLRSCVKKILDKEL